MAMTEEQIERRVESMVDHLDRLLMSGQMTQGDYNAAIHSLYQWAEDQWLSENRWLSEKPIDAR
jgi:hypothetical protein